MSAETPERRGTPRTDHTAELASGHTLLLVTDGLVERRDTDLDAGLARLQEALRDLGETPLEELCDTLLERMLRVDGADGSAGAAAVAALATSQRHTRTGAVPATSATASSPTQAAPWITRVPDVASSSVASPCAMYTARGVAGR